ncbi:DUF3131 domain-containing protein [Marimonas arenosa]|uniref:DUF3131 domain-containing protein n=1 Tax=Marimonas arenosa TaxID=1795305 RepID=A0AAE3WEH4_9RHOB|nr:DUF3131 domain-containing protein [Marimonas arenosa]MDQ2091801.1 DUF3131 domain-containing protein [Marimonas arenosa]
MKRRSFLASTLAAGICTTVPVRPAAADTGILSAAVVITDISADTEPAFLMHVVETLLDQGIWITCAIRLPDDREAESKLAATLQALISDGNGVDLAVELPGLSGLSPYFQSRAVFTARNRLGRLLGVSPASVPLRTVLCDDVEKPNEPTGVRASGIRNVLVRPQTDATVRSESWRNGVVRFFGGQQVDPDSSFSILPGDSGEENAVLFYLSADSLADVVEDRLYAWTASFAETLIQRELAGKLALMTVSDLQLRDNFDQRRLVSVVLELPETATPAQHEVIADFRDALAQVQIPSALRPAGEAFWIDRTDRGATLTPVTLACGGDGPSRMSATQKLGPGHAVLFTGGKSRDLGIDGCSVLHLPVVRFLPGSPATDIDPRLSGGEDIVISLTADQLSRANERRRTLANLQALRQDAITQYVPVNQLAAALHTNEPVAIRHRLTRAAVADVPRQPARKPGDADRARLLEDARQAWGYFEEYTERSTGLAPATVDSRPGGKVHRAVTMWDVGSNLNAIVAATEIGLIDRKDAETRFRRIFPNLRGRETDNRLLPQGWIRTDRHRWGIRDFDGCDGGRLMSSLDNVRRRFGMSDALGKLVDSWDLDEILIDRKIHSVIGRKLISTYGSHCAHYSALAFRRWGLDVASPYETFQGREPGDGEIAMLEAVSRIGPLGTEPLLLEAMELGMSPESRYLAEVLLAAMEEEFRESGRLLCPSETPIDQPPWFIYQGLNLGSGPRSWRLDTVAHEPEYMTDAAADELLTFSTKAAFLWAAYQPGDFTRRLLDFARETGRNTVGFVSGVNVKTQRPTSGYADLNTNGIILQAISHLLRETG